MCGIVVLDGGPDSSKMSDTDRILMYLGFFDTYYIHRKGQGPTGVTKEILQELEDLLYVTKVLEIDAQAFSQSLVRYVPVYRLTDFGRNRIKQLWKEYRESKGFETE